ncbi:MAG: DHH family phosphoesterase [Ignavibacteriaceae bacterium]|nr:DHH family phosphoesterase [Ignavibacteriaceae bacterium]
MIDFKTLESIIINNEKFILTTHVNPDADAIGSEIALYEILNDLGKEVKIINHSDTPYNLKFLDKNNVIEKFNTGFHSKLFDKDDVLVALDFNRSDRMVSMREIFVKSKKLKLCIDHHQDQEDFVDHQFIDTAYSATGHIIYDFIKVTNIVKLNKRIAYPIYAAIMTDTGSFRFEKTTAELHKIASELLSFDITPGEVYDNIYDQSKFSKVTTWPCSGINYT